MKTSLKKMDYEAPCMRVAATYTLEAVCANSSKDSQASWEDPFNMVDDSDLFN